MIISTSPTLCQRSDRDKIEYIYRRYYPLMRYVAGKVLDREGAEAEDAVHDAMVKLIKNVDAIDVTDPQKLKNLCCIVARNCATDRRRKKENRNASLSVIPDGADDAERLPEETVIGEETLGSVLRAIRSLPEAYRDACVLKYVYKLKERQIAALLGVPEKTASTRIHRGKMLLRDTLRKEGIHE